jgi:hypothetical protein
MLNRYGLFDIEKFLREQDEPQPADAMQSGVAPPLPPPPPASPPEDPDEKIDQARQKNQDADLVDFRRRHADEIYSIAHGDDDPGDDFGRNASLRSLQQKFDTSGVDQPFFVLFDPATTGMDGQRHLALIADLHHEGRIVKDTAKFHSAGDASAFAEWAPSIRPDLSFEVDEQDRTSVVVTPAAPEPSSA